MKAKSLVSVFFIILLVSCGNKNGKNSASNVNFRVITEEDSACFEKYSIANEKFRALYEKLGAINGRDTTIIGKTENGKGEAFVVADKDEDLYTVEGVDNWDENILGKMAKVSGKLFVEKYDPPKVGDEIKQQMVGIKITIQNPQWELVK